MATTKQQENMLLTEHFTWPPISLIDDIINMINEVLYRCTNILDTELSSIDASVLGFADRAAAEKRTVEVDGEGNPVFPEAKLEIEEGVLKLETLVENAVDKNFDKLEIWTLRNVFCLERGSGDAADIGRWIRLGHYENLSNPPKHPTITPESLQHLRRKLQETEKLHAVLLAEKTRNDIQIQRLRSLLQPSIQKREPRSSTSPAKPANGSAGDTDAPFAFLTHTPAAQALGIQTLPPNSTAAVSTSDSTPILPPTTTTTTTDSTSTHNPLTTHTQFTTSQLPYLRTLLSNLLPYVATTALPVHREGAREELAKERRVYIESQSKRILERRGVDTRDGVEGAVEGWTGSAEEVRGLESVVKGLGRQQGVVRKDGEKEMGEGEGEGEEMDLS